MAALVSNSTVCFHSYKQNFKSYLGTGIYLRKWVRVVTLLLMFMYIEALENTENWQTFFKEAAP